MKKNLCRKNNLQLNEKFDAGKTIYKEVKKTDVGKTIYKQVKKTNVGKTIYKQEKKLM